MTGSTFQRLITRESLNSTWEQFWRTASKQHATGVDGITPREFQQSHEKNLERIRVALRDDAYSFALLRAHPVPKKDATKFRLICIPTVRDRIVQRVLARHLTEQADKLGITNEVSFGFLPSKEGHPRGVQAARDRAVQLRRIHPWAYKSDISSFFDRIPRPELIDMTASRLRAPSLKPILSAAASCEIDENTGFVRRLVRTSGIQRGRGVRQGMPLSPLFANVILRDFDRELIKRGLNVVRYADDFLALADSAEECIEIDKLCREELAKLGFDLPAFADCSSKTYIAQPDEEIEFLGLALSPDVDGGYRLLLTGDQIAKVKGHLHDLKDIEQQIRNGTDITRLGKKIDSVAGGYRAAYRDAHNVNWLEAILKDARTDIMTGVLTAAFGPVAVQSLPSQMKKFFCLDA